MDTKPHCYTLSGRTSALKQKKKNCNKYLKTENRRVLRGNLQHWISSNDCFFTVSQPVLVSFWPFQNTLGENIPREVSHYPLL